MKIVLNCHSEYAYVKAYPRHTPKATVLRINIPIHVENGLYQMIFFIVYMSFVARSVVIPIS